MCSYERPHSIQVATIGQEGAIGLKWQVSLRSDCACPRSGLRDLVGRLSRWKEAHPAISLPCSSATKVSWACRSPKALCTRHCPNPRASFLTAIDGQ